MTAVPLPLSSAPGVKPQEGGGRLINCYAEKLGEAARFPVVWRRSPGLRELLEITGHSHLRGAMLGGAVLHVVMNQRHYTVTESAGVFTAVNRGELVGTLPVTIAQNNAATPNIVVVTQNGAFNLFDASSPTAFADTDLPVPNSVAFLDAYLLFTIGDGRIFATDVNGVAIATNSFTTEQGLNLLRGVVFRGEFYALGDKWTGVYRNAATSPFPLERRFVIPRGIAGTHAIAGGVGGGQSGWIDALLWAADNNTVVKLNGYTPEKVSSSAVDRAIETCADPLLLEASVYMAGGNAFWVLTSPGEWTWELNVSTGNWNEKGSYNDNDWRGRQPVWAFKRWIAGDRDTGHLFKIDESFYREENDPLVYRLRTGVLANFPAGIMIPRADFDFTVAVGNAAGEDPIQTDPSVSIRWSLDGGHSFGSWVIRSLGAQGNSQVKVTVNRIGTSRGKGVVFEVAVSDPVHVGLMGVQVPVEQRAA